MVVRGCYAHSLGCPTTAHFLPSSPPLMPHYNGMYRCVPGLGLVAARRQRHLRHRHRFVDAVVDAPSPTCGLQAAGPPFSYIQLSYYILRGSVAHAPPRAASHERHSSALCAVCACATFAIVLPMPGERIVDMVPCEDWATLLVVVVVLLVDIVEKTSNIYSLSASLLNAKKKTIPAS